MIELILEYLIKPLDSNELPNSSVFKSARFYSLTARVNFLTLRSIILLLVLFISIVSSGAGIYGYVGYEHGILWCECKQSCGLHGSSKLGIETTIRRLFDDCSYISEQVYQEFT